MSEQKIGFIGLGNIGKPMAENLAKQDTPLKVFDVASEPCESLASQGAEVARDIHEFSDCSVIGVCVRDDQDVEDLLFTQGLLETLKPDSIIAIHCTVERDNILRWSKAANERGIKLIDAPISGGADGARDASLVFMLGGEQDTIVRFEHAFAVAGKLFVHAGDIGSGIVLKLANNMMTYSAFAAISEANALLESANMPLEKLLQVGECNGVVSAQMHKFITNREALAAGCSEEDMAAIFSPFAGLAEKDLHHALALAQQNQVDIPQAQLNSRVIHDVFLKQGSAKRSS